MSNQQHHQYYNSENAPDSAIEVEAMLSSLVGSQPRPSNGYEYNQQPVSFESNLYIYIYI